MIALIANRNGTREVLKPDEIIDAGRPLTVEPSAAAMLAYGSAIRSDRAFGIGLRSVVTMWSDKLEEWPAFVREVFARLYDDDGCKPIDEKLRSPWGASAMKVMESTAEWSTLRAAACLSRSTAATSAKTLSEAVGQAMRLGDVPQDVTRDPRTIEEELESIGRVAAQHGASEKEVSELLNAATVELAGAIAARRTLDSRVDKVRDKVVAAVKATARQAEAMAEKENLFASMGFSREGAGSIEEVAPNMCIDARMMAILRWVGRFRDADNGLDAKSSGHCDVVGVNPTRDITKATPRTLSEIASGGIRGLATMRDLLDGAAQGWDQQSMTPQVKGDVAILVDRSGSMQGDREHRARGLAVASLVSAFREGRRCVAGSFAGHDDCTISVVMPGDLKTLTDGIQSVCRKAEGGTDVDYAIDQARWAMENCVPGGGMRSPDVLVITDGYFDPVDKTVLARLKDYRLFGVMLEEGASDNHDEFTRCWDVVGDLDEKQAAEIIRTMRAPRKADV